MRKKTKAVAKSEPLLTSENSESRRVERDVDSWDSRDMLGWDGCGGGLMMGVRGLLDTNEDRRI